MLIMSKIKYGPYDHIYKTTTK